MKFRRKLKKESSKEISIKVPKEISIKVPKEIPMEIPKKFRYKFHRLVSNTILKEKIESEFRRTLERKLQWEE